MKNLIYTLAITVLLFSSACKDDEPTLSNVDDLQLNISNILTTSKSIYDEANNGDWISITETEYNNLATELSSITRIGIPESSFKLNNATTHWSSQPHITALTGASVDKVPVGSLLFAFKFIRNGSFTSTGSRVKLSETSDTQGFENVGNALPDASGTTNSIHYYALKVDGSTTTAENSYVGFFCNGSVIGASISLLPDVATNWKAGDANTGDGLSLNQHEVFYQALSRKY